MSNLNIPRLYPDSEARDMAWLVERVLEDRAESAPAPVDPEEAGDE
jgi:hypothetical protein